MVLTPVVLQQPISLIIWSSSILQLNNFLATAQFRVYTTNLQHDKVTQWVNASTLNWKVPGSNPAGVFGQALESNLLTKLVVMIESNKIKRNNGCLLVTVIQSLPWNN